MIRSIIFDMDGTLADTSPGILASYKHLASTINKKIPSDDELKKILGGPLPSNISNLFNINPDDLNRCISIYRNYYKHHGAAMSIPYNHLKETLETLRDKQITLSIATMKAETFAKELIKKWNINDYFSIVIGADSNDLMTKKEMINKILHLTNISPCETIMIGDTLYDYKSAHECRVNFIAATYGFQLTNDYCVNNKIPCINNINELTRIIQ